MSNRFYTLLVIPEKTSKVRRFVVPGWLFNATLIGVFFSGILAVMMIMNYAYVMGQIDENKELKIESRRLRQQVQIFENKITSIEETMERIETFGTRLKIITNIVEQDDLVQRLNDKLPEASSNIAGIPASEAVQPADDETEEDIRLFESRSRVEGRLAKLNRKTLYEEQKLQDLYELLIDQKSFLAALPTRRPATGYFTSGFGVRRSPYGGRIKMHEGLDIANQSGTPIKATANGVIAWAGTKPGYGRTVIISHGYGLETWYSHLKQSQVEKGQKVRRGDKIAIMGNTGRSTGPHVHYEVRVNDTPIDPLSYILED